MRRSRFLPIFFTLLTIAFVIVLVIRLRNDMRQETIAGESAPAPPLTKTEVAPAAPTPAGTATKTATAAPTTRPAPKTAIALRPSATTPPRVVRPAAVVTPQKQPSPKPSMIARVLAPIAKVFSNDNRGATAQSRGASGSPSGSSSSSGNKGDKTDQPKDPNSDTTPPQLLSIEFSPPQVQDGESASVIITASDDLSGIRGISGTISSPTGKALQGFATQREGDTGRYVGRVAIAKDSEQGLWKVTFLNLSDNASNSVTLSYAQGTVPPSAVLRVVSSNSDNTPPTLKNIWVDKRAIHNGEKDVIFVQADDDKSGVNLVSAVFHSPTGVARIGAGCQHAGDSDTWQCELSAPTCVDCGDWQLEQVTLQDKANNLATFRQDNPLVAATKINIAGSACDNTPPALQSLVLDTNDVVLGDRGAVITVTVMASDDNCGVAGVSGQYVGPGTGSGGFFPLSQSGDSGTWVGRIQLDPRAPRGVWRINSIQLNDAGHNLRVYYGSDPLLASGIFHVR